MEFVQQQAQQERAVFDVWLKRATVVLSLMVVVVGGALTFIGVTTVHGIRDLARKSTEQAIKQTNNEVHQRIDAEFQAPAIQATIRKAAAERTSAEFRPVIHDEVKNQLENNPEFKVILRQEVQLQARHFIAVNGQPLVAAELKKATAPRKLTDSQKQRLKALLLPYKGNGIEILCLIGAQEASSLANEFLSVLEASGWRVDFSGSVGWDKPFRGIAVATNPSQPALPNAVAVENALREAGIKFQTRTATNISINHVQLWISEKEIADLP